MASSANYPPQAPSDGFGNINLNSPSCAIPRRLQIEATQYAIHFSAEADHCSFSIGCSDFRTNKAFIWVMESARLLAAGEGGREPALELLRKAAREVARVSAQFNKKGRR